MARHRQRHITGWRAVLLAPLAILAVPLVIVAERLFDLQKPGADLTKEDVKGYLQDFLNGRGGYWDWDDFTCIPIADPSLEWIREEAALVQLPLTEDGRAELQELLDQVRRM
ncbi:MAG: hypothetical protein H0T82_03375 [Sphingomonas sp.]|nr:hypothetical protein [Sphingomonas sp.]